jgi:hypothetical protein
LLRNSLRVSAMNSSIVLVDVQLIVLRRRAPDQRANPADDTGGSSAVPDGRSRTCRASSDFSQTGPWPSPSLISRVWPGVVVTEEILQVQISASRKAFGQDRDFIRTEFGRGNRFTAAVRSAVASGACQWSARRRDGSK